MESRTIELTLRKAKDWYNSHSAELREIALQAYTEDELKTFDFTDIQTVYDALKSLGMSYDTQVDILVNNYKCASPYLLAIYKLHIIRRALNRNWKVDITKEIHIYCPRIRIYTSKEAKRVADANDWKLGSTFSVKGREYTIVGGDVYKHYVPGFDSISTFSSINDIERIMLLGCENKEIAEHMSRYFSKEIFDVIYSSAIIP